MSSLAFAPAPLASSEAGWRCYFETDDGLVLATGESFEAPEEAAAWGQLVLRHPGSFELLDPDDATVPATLADPRAGMTVEAGEVVETALRA